MIKKKSITSLPYGSSITSVKAPNTRDILDNKRGVLIKGEAGKYFNWSIKQEINKQGGRNKDGDWVGNK